MRELTLSANRANATILHDRSARAAGRRRRRAPIVDQSEWRTYIQKTTSTLRYMAEETGGFPVVNTNDFAGELKRIDAETSDYYVLGFYSSNPDPTKRTRSWKSKSIGRTSPLPHARAYSLKTQGKPPAPPPS